MATMTLDELVTQLQAAYGSRLNAVVLYGSGATAEHTRRSDYNILVLLESLDAGGLAPAAAVARAWRDAGNPPPMTMTTDEWRRSADVFPMEYADILDRHRVLYGAAPFGATTVSMDHLRLQLEQQAMGKLLQLRQGTLLAGTDAKRQAELIGASLSTMMVLFRAVLRLHGERPADDRVAVAERVGAIAGLDPAPFVTAVQHARGHRPLPAGETGALLAGYLNGLQRLNAYLDSFTPPR